MKIRNQLILILAVLFAFALIVNAQEQNTSNKYQPKAIKAAVPAIPSAFIAQDIENEVIVEVEINSEGNVTAAKSISGHPLVRKSAEDSAKNWKFNPIDDKEAIRRAKLSFVYQKPAGKKETVKISKKQLKITIRPEKPELNF